LLIELEFFNSLNIFEKPSKAAFRAAFLFIFYTLTEQRKMKNKTDV